VLSSSEGIDPSTVLQGGDAFLLFRGELRFPIYGDLQAGLFTDLGNVWRNASEMTPLELRPTTGIGLRVNTPVGPLAFDYGILVRRRRELDEGFGAFHFSIGLF
jgi:outer membrane translocation and assembly module TamA